MIKIDFHDHNRPPVRPILTVLKSPKIIPLVVIIRIKYNWSSLKYNYYYKWNRALRVHQHRFFWVSFFWIRINVNSGSGSLSKVDQDHWGRGYLNWGRDYQMKLVLVCVICTSSAKSYLVTDMHTSLDSWVVLKRRNDLVSPIFLGTLQMQIMASIATIITLWLTNIVNLVNLWICIMRWSVCIGMLLCERVQHLQDEGKSLACIQYSTYFSMFYLQLSY